MSTELIEKVDGILSKAELPDRHTFFQIEKFIIGKEVTAQAQLWAIVRELQARRETVDNYRRDLEEAEDNLELFDLRIERLNRHLRICANRKKTDGEEGETDLDIQEHEINIRKLQRDKESLCKSARKVARKLKSVQEEMTYLVSGYDKIVSLVGGMKPLDDEESQREMWNERLLEDFNLRIILQRPLDPEFVRTVLCLHDDAPVKRQVVSMIDRIQHKMIADRREKPQIETKAKTAGK